jgi:hypothetical protein
MIGFESDLVKEWQEAQATMSAKPRSGNSVSPATNLIFEKGDSELLDSKEKSIFHSFTMRLAYLAKRAKAELSVAISYLSTQVTKPTKYDMSTLDRFIRYVNENIGTGICLTAEGTEKSVKVRGFIDASFGCHDDGKSHTGVLVTLGSGPVYVRSVKQCIVTKSSAESELVALSDETGALMHIKDFIEGQGYNAELIFLMLLLRNLRSDK